VKYRYFRGARKACALRLGVLGGAGDLLLAEGTMIHQNDATLTQRPSFTMTSGPESRTVVCSPPSFEHTLALPPRASRPSYPSPPASQIVPIARRSSTTFVIDRTVNVPASVHDELAIRMTWLAYAVAISAFGVLVGVGLGLFLAPAHFAVL